jgi:hypothetical protein
VEAARISGGTIPARSLHTAGQTVRPCHRGNTSCLPAPIHPETKSLLHIAKQLACLPCL